eukprot:RCo055761
MPLFGLPGFSRNSSGSVSSSFACSSGTSPSPTDSVSRVFRPHPDQRVSGVSTDAPRKPAKGSSQQAYGSTAKLAPTPKPKPKPKKTPCGHGNPALGGGQVSTSSQSITGAQDVLRFFSGSSASSSAEKKLRPKPLPASLETSAETGASPSSRVATGEAQCKSRTSPPPPAWMNVDYRHAMEKLALARQRCAHLKRSMQSKVKYQVEFVTLLKPVEWELDKLEPLRKDFTELMKPVLQTDAESEKWRAENNVCVKAFFEVPAPLTQFREVDFGENVNKLLSAQYTRPTPIQAQAWSVLLAGHDCVGLSQTGSGKTLAFCLPALVHVRDQPPVKEGEVLVLFLCPTRELASQTYTELLKYAKAADVRVGVAYGGTCEGARVMDQALDLFRGTEMLVGTPGRVIEFVEAELIRLNRVVYAVVDEADRMLDLRFTPQIGALLSQTRPDRLTALFGATWSKEVLYMAGEFMRSPVRVIVNKADENHANTSVQQRVYVTDYPDKPVFVTGLLRQLLEEHPEAQILVFVNKKKEANRLATALRSKWAYVNLLHGSLKQKSREKAVKRFRSNKPSILVASDLAARGLDVQELTCVINYDLPQTMENYVTPDWPHGPRRPGGPCHRHGGPQKGRQHVAPAGAVPQGRRAGGPRGAAGPHAHLAQDEAPGGHGAGA